MLLLIIFILIIIWSIIGILVFTGIQKDIVRNNVPPNRMLVIIFMCGPIVWFLTLITYFLNSEEQLKKKSERNKKILANE